MTIDVTVGSEGLLKGKVVFQSQGDHRFWWVP
jgi:hypothetical protein